MRCSLPRSFRVSSGESHSERQRIKPEPGERFTEGKGFYSVLSKTPSRMIDDFRDFGNVAKISKTAAEHLTDFDAPIYNVWKQPEQKQSLTDFQHRSN
jgi:hypothetical protein